MVTESCSASPSPVQRTSPDWAKRFVVMKTKRSLMVTGLIGVMALICAAYCFWLMTVPLSYDLVYVVVIGFVLSLGVLVIALIRLLILVIRLRGSRRAPDNPKITPPA